MEIIKTSLGHVNITKPENILVKRVGYKDSVWNFPEVKKEGALNFGTRWEDPEGNWRTLYLAGNTVAAFVEVLATFTPDHLLLESLDEIEEDPEDKLEYPTQAAGCIDTSWGDNREIGEGELKGKFFYPTGSASMGELRRKFLRTAMNFGFIAFDTAALRINIPRDLTQQIGAAVYKAKTFEEEFFDGIEFQSRFGDDFTLWAIFERQPFDLEDLVKNRTVNDVKSHEEALAMAKELLNLT